MTQKGLKQQKGWALDFGWVQVLALWKQRVCKGRIPEDIANLENANQVDITATLRHHESLQNSMAACSCKGCDSRQNRDSEAGSLCKGARPCPAREGAVGVGTGASLLCV